MEILDSSEPFLHWDRNLSELSEAGEIDCVLYTNLNLGVQDAADDGRSDWVYREKSSCLAGWESDTVEAF
eukprot:superscaffoldBa00006106_g21147